MSATAITGDSVRAEVFTLLGQFILGAMLTNIDTPQLMERLRSTSAEWDALAAAANADPTDMATLVPYGTAVATYLGPDLDEAAREQLGVLLASVASGQRAVAASMER